MELTKVQESAELIVDEMLHYASQQMPNVSKSVWDEVKSQVDYGKYYQLLVPIYQKYYTTAEIKELILFFASPVGRKYIITLPDVNTEIYGVGKAFGQQLGLTMGEVLTKYGYR